MVIAAWLQVPARFETFDGLRLTTRAWKVEDKHYVVLAVKSDETLAPAPEVTTESETVEAEDAASATEPDTNDDPEEVVDHAQEAADMTAITGDWVYVIPSYKYGNMPKTIYDLLKPLPIEDPGNQD